METQIKITIGDTTLSLADAMELCKQLAPLHRKTRVLRPRVDVPTPNRPCVLLAPVTMEQLKEYARVNGLTACLACTRIIHEWLRNNGATGVVVSNREKRWGSRLVGLHPYLPDETRELAEKYRNGQRYSVFLRSIIEAFFNNNQSTIINHQTKEQHENVSE